MSLWWLQPGWAETRCIKCGAKIWPEGDPDHGVCFTCFTMPPQEQFPEELPDSVDPDGVRSEDGT